MVTAIYKFLYNTKKRQDNPGSAVRLMQRQVYFKVISYLSDPKVNTRFGRTFKSFS